MSTKLQEVLLRPRQCAADWLAFQARDLAGLARHSGNPTLLVFACLEGRNAIEQVWCVILEVINGKPLDEVFLENCRKRQDGFLAAIRDAEPRYRLFSRFTAISMQLDSKMPYKGISWDLKRLKRLWQSLSGYCHAQADPRVTLDRPAWFSTGLSLIDELFGYFKQEMSSGVTSILNPNTMPAPVRMVWEDFAAGRITEDQTRIRLRIVT